MLRRETLTARDFRWVAVAIEQAEMSAHRFRVGAVLTVASSVHVAHNRIRNSPKISYEHATVHAEDGCIRKAGRTKGGTMYVARIGAYDQLLPSFPCQKCFPMLREAGIRRIVWWDGTKWVRAKMPSGA